MCDCKGVYLYMEADELEVCSDVRLVSPRLPVQNYGEAKCLRFSYAAHGRHVASLGVLDERGRALWNMRRLDEEDIDPRAVWPYAEVTLPTTLRYFVFIAVRGLGAEGDIAIDNIRVTPLTCDGMWDNPKTF